MFWNKGKFKRAIPFSSATNTPIFRLASSTNSYRAFVAKYEQAFQAMIEEQVAPSPHLIPPDKDEFIAEENITYESPEPISVSEGEIDSGDETVIHSNRSIDLPPSQASPSANAQRIGTLTFDPSPPLEEDEHIDYTATDDQAELMRWHYRLGHLTFAKLKQLAINGEIPKRLVKVKNPKCAGCIYGAMTRVPWKSKGQQIQHVFVATKPGQCVSVDQMISTQVGFVAQLKGKLTTQRYRAATIFVDHYSRLRYVHLMHSLSSEEMMAAKRAFEIFANQHGVRILHYHADNGRFADNAFKSACKQANQQLTFCGVNAHFQNGIAERSIRDLTENARKQLLHARQRWPDAVHLSLWPYALRSACLLHNTLPVMQDGSSRLEIFSGIRVGMRMRDIHAFGCPVFALQTQLASGGILPRWSPRARLGLNLGQSPAHARNVNLVLSLTTGLVSPQYHCMFDDFFEMTKHGGPDMAVSGIWKQLAGLSRPTTADIQYQPTLTYHAANNFFQLLLKIPHQKMLRSNSMLLANSSLILAKTMWRFLKQLRLQVVSVPEGGSVHYCAPCKSPFHRRISMVAPV